VQQIAGLPRRDHPRRLQPRESQRHHQHREHQQLRMTDRNPRLREPQITLHDLARPIHDPVRAGSMPAYSGRICRTRSFNVVIECVQPIRSAITVAGIRGKSANSFRTSSSTPSTNEPRTGRSYFGGRSDANAARTVFLATPNRREISLIGMFSDRCKRRISAQFSTVITLQGSYGGVKIHPTPQGQYSRVVDTRLGRMTLVPRLSRSASMGASPLSREKARRALGPGTYTEVWLQADEVQITGRLDLLNLTTDHADIVDHKTGLEDPTHLDQLRFYGVLWENDLVANASRTPLGELTVAYPNGDLTIDAPEQSELAGISESIRARVQEAGERAGADVPVATTGAHCLLCPVRSLCDTYWATMLQDPSATLPGTWFDFEGVVGAQNGAKSWWMLDPSSSEPALLLRTASAQVSFAEGQRLRFVGIRLDADPEVEAVVATLATSSELFAVSVESSG